MIPRFTDHAANERTYLAWIRTAIAVMALGFLVEKFDLFLRYLAHTLGGPQQTGRSVSVEYAGVGLLVFAVTVVIVATVRFVKNERLIDSAQSQRYGAPVSDIMLGTVVALMGILLILYLGRSLFL